MLIKKLALAMTIAGMTVGGTAIAANETAAMEAIAAAKASAKTANNVGGEWRDTGKMIKAAEEAAAKGEYDAAVAKAAEAEAQGRLGESQAISQQKVGNPGYLYN